MVAQEKEPTRLVNLADAAGRVRALGLLVVLTSVVCALLLVFEPGDRHQPQDVITGAQGPFPAAFADRPPSRPDHVIDRKLDGGASLPSDSGVAHGLAVERTDAGVQAVNLRTGKVYWRYERGGDEQVLQLAVTERTVVIGYWSHGAELVGVDLRQGRPLWRANVWNKHGAQLMRLEDGQVVVPVSAGTLGAFGERDGRRLWTVKVPGSCPDLHVTTVYVLPRHLSAVHLECGTGNDEESGLVLGIDNQTGDVLWHQETEGPGSLVRAGAHELIAPDPDSPATVRVLDVNRQGISTRATFSPDSWEPVASGSGIAVSATDSRSQDDDHDHDDLLRAYDARNGHLAWRLSAPHGQVYGLPAVADGRMYVVRQPSSADVDDRVQADLLVLDAKTGHLLHTTHLRLPAGTRLDGGDLTVDSVADGAVIISRQHRELLIATD